jgi:rare lipoprotein A
MKQRFGTMLLVLMSALLFTLSKAHAKASGIYQTGMTSWYGRAHHGKKTASGERFNMYGLTAAHRTLPLGTMVRVTNVANGKSVIAKVNDRGPFHGNRVLDLSQGAAKALDMMKSGTAKVQIEILGKN